MDNNNYNFEEEDREKSSLLEKGMDIGQTADNLSKVKKTADAAKTAKAAADTAKVAKTAAATAKTGKLAAALAKLGPALPIILYIVGGFILIVIIAVIFQSIIDSFGIGKGISEEKLTTNPDYTQLTLDELAAKYSVSDLCGNEDIFQKMKLFFDELTVPIDSVCEGLRAINSTVDYYETKYATDNLKLSPGLILSTIVYSYASGDIIDKDGNKVDDSRPMKVLENIFRKENSGFITRTKIRELVEYMIFHQKYKYYNWEVVSSNVDKYDDNGNPIHTTKYWGCKEVDSEEYRYMSYDKYLINLRYGYDETTGIYFAGKWINEIEPARTGYEKEKNEVSSWVVTPDWCKMKDIPYSLPANTSGVTNLAKANYNKDSLDFYAEFDITREDKLYNYLQSADYEDIEKIDVFEPVYSRDRAYNLIDNAQLNYKNGFIYNQFLNFSESTYDEKNTPKNLEYSIARIMEHEQTFNSILGVNMSYISGGGINAPGNGAATQFGLNLVDNALAYKVRWDSNGWKEGDPQSITGINTSSAWCARFVSYIVKNTPGANEKINFSSGGVAQWITYFASTDGLYFFHSAYSLTRFPGSFSLTNGSAYVPKAGDLVFYDYHGRSDRRGWWNGNPYHPDGQEHINIVSSVDLEKGIIYTIGGNESDSVKTSSYSINSSSILGYGVWDYN